MRSESPGLLDVILHIIEVAYTIVTELWIPIILIVIFAIWKAHRETQKAKSLIVKFDGDSDSKQKR